MNEKVTPGLGLATLIAFLNEKSPLGPLKVMAGRPLPRTGGTLSAPRCLVRLPRPDSAPHPPCCQHLAERMLVEARKIMDTLFGVDAWDDLPRIWTPILKAIAYISPGAWILWRKIPRPGYKKHLQTLGDYLCAIISTRRAANPTPDSSHLKPDLLQHLIEEFILSCGCGRAYRDCRPERC